MAPIAQSPQTLADVLSQNQERKYEMARAAIASGSWDTPKGVLVHEVREDETLYKLTQVYRVDAAAIAASNGISAATPLHPGTKLVIPPVSGIIHKVRSGDTLEAISKFYNVPEGEIIKYTSLQSSELLEVDQPLVIPGNVASLIKVREDDAKQRLAVERDRLRQRLQEVEGKTVLVSHSAASTKNQPKYTLYKVQRGDTIEAIAKRYGISKTLIAQHNKLDNLHWLELGKELKIPALKNTSSMQTVAYNDQKPMKIVFSTGNLEVQPARVNQSEISKIASKKSEVVTVKVKAATPITLPEKPTAAETAVAPTPALQPQTTLPSPWDSLMHLSGSDLAKTMPSQPLLEEISLNKNTTVATTTLPVETESVLRITASLFPFSPEKLLEQQSTVRSVAKVIPSTQPANEPSAKPASLMAKVRSVVTVASTAIVEQRDRQLPSTTTTVAQPATEPSVQLSKLAVAPSIQSFGLIEQPIEHNNQTNGNNNTVKQIPSANTVVRQVRPAVESTVDISKLAVAPSIQSFSAIEQSIEHNLDRQKPAEPSKVQPAVEPSSLKLPKLPKVAVAPFTPSVGIVEQNDAVATKDLPIEATTTQPAIEPPVKLPKLAVSFTVPSDLAKATEQQSVSNKKPTELALLPESEARMTSVEVKRLELEVEQLNHKVKKAEIEAAARQAEAVRQAEAARRAEELRRAESVKIAAANISPSNSSNRSFDPGREAIANTGKASPLAPELPELVAKAYLPDASNYGNGYGVSTGLVWPAEGTLTSGYGWRWGRIHQGIDIAAPTGTPIMAAASGTVDFAGWNDGGYGNMVDIRHDDGTVTRYAHMSAIYIKEGQPVSQAQLIGAMGSTGFSTGPHLHFEVRPGGGRAVDPMSFFASARR